MNPDQFTEKVVQLVREALHPLSASILVALEMSEGGKHAMSIPIKLVKTPSAIYISVNVAHSTKEDNDAEGMMQIEDENQPGLPMSEPATVTLPKKGGAK